MVFIFHSPKWFYGTTLAIKALGIIIAFLIAYYGYKAYKITEEKRYYYFGIGFIALLVGFIITGIALIAHAIAVLFFNYGALALKLQEIIPFYHLIYLAEILFFLIAYLMFIILYLDINRKDIIYLLLFLVIAISIPAYSNFTYFHAISICLLGFIICHQVISYNYKKNKNLLMVIIAFSLLSISHLFFLLQQIPTYANFFYVLANLVQLIAFLFLLIMLARVALRK